MLIEIVAHYSQIVSVLIFPRAQAMLIEVVAHCSQHVNVSILL